jgi:hypothetical protein
MRPLNADELLDRFLDFNLVAVFKTAFSHGFTERHAAASRSPRIVLLHQSRNHDGNAEKVIFTARPGGTVHASSWK